MRTHGGSTESTDDHGDPSAAAELSIEAKQVRLRAAVQVPAHEAARLLRLAAAILFVAASLCCFVLAYVASRGDQLGFAAWTVIAVSCCAGLGFLAFAAVVAVRRRSEAGLLVEEQYQALQQPMPQNQVAYRHDHHWLDTKPSEPGSTSAGKASQATHPAAQLRSSPVGRKSDVGTADSANPMPIGEHERADDT
jgi:hypothetical protein